MKIVINKCYGGFGLSVTAYERLIELGVPVKQYIEQKRDPQTHLYLPEPANDGKVIFDRLATPENERDPITTSLMKLTGNRYWDSWTDYQRDHPLVVQVVEELGERANGKCAKLAIVEVPDDTDWEISEYDGNEHIAEKHETWS